MCVLMLRGPQTPGELKQRTERMHAFGELSAVHGTLERLIDRDLVGACDRRPGQKEERYTQLLGEERERARLASAISPDESERAAARPRPRSTATSRSSELAVERLEQEVAELRAAMRDPVRRARFDDLATARSSL